MCTKILKKESSSRALAFVLLMFMMPFGFIGNTQSCGAMENVDEKKPLLGHDNTSINGNARDVEQGREILTSVIVQSDDLPPKIDIPEDLKEELDDTDAAVALNDIQTGLYYLQIFKAGQTGLIDELFKDGEYSDKKTFEALIIKKAVDGADQEGSLQVYFRANDSKITKLIQKVEELGGREAVLRDIILAERQQRNLEKNLAESLQHDHEINLAKLKSVDRTNLILKLCLPAAIIVTGIGTWALTWYLGGK